MASFAELPSELVDSIVSYLTQPTLYAISQVSKSLYIIALPFLYRHVNLDIAPGRRIPRIDRFCFNVLDQPKLAGYVRSLRVGLPQREGVYDEVFFLPRDELQHKIFFERALEVLNKEPLFLIGEDLREALWAGDYGAYAALLLLILPSLHGLDLAGNDTLRPLYDLLLRIAHEPNSEVMSPSQTLSSFIGPIEQVSFNVDLTSGRRHEERSTVISVWKALNLPAIRKLEFYIPDTHPWRIFRNSDLPQGTFQPTLITTMVIRHTNCILKCLRGILIGTPHLLSLTCELWFDFSKVTMDGNGTLSTWLPLGQWTEELKLVKSTLEMLVLSVEFCDSEKPFFRQPDIRKYFSGCLDLRDFSRLQTLEVPVPFISGDPSFSIMIDFEPCLPASLRHLTLRTDMSRAQLAYPFDTSIMPESPSFQDSRDEAIYLDGARIDVTCIFQVTLFLIDRLHCLESVTVWQPSDPTLSWFKPQIDDFATSCRNKSISAKVMYPLVIRWKSAVNWDLVREDTLFDPCYPDSGGVERLFRGERNGAPLGLATQYHVGEYEKGHVRRHR